jgi:hypothetical protein
VKSLVFWLVLTLVGLGQSDISGAFERRQFRGHGYVRWIAGEKLMLLADNGAPIAIDLTEAEQSAYQGLTNTPLLIRVRVVSGDSGLPEPTSELADPHPGRTLWHRPTRAIRGSRTRQRILTENETSRRLLPDSATLRRGEPWSV